jgi:hypothetical protein
LVLQLLVSLPRLPPNMSLIGRQTTTSKAEVVHEREASPDVVILMMTMTTMMTAQEVEASMRIPSIVRLKWLKLELPPLLLRE